MTIPLLPVPHNWVSTVEHTRRWPTAVIDTRDGHEQAIAQTIRPRETLRYEMTTVTAGAALDLFSAVVAAVTAGTSEARGQVRVPRWEDAMVLAAPAAPGDTTLSVAITSGDDAGYRRFANGGEVALWDHGAAGVVTVPLAASGAVGSSTLTLLAAIGTTWPAGTRVAPVSVGRIVSDVSWKRFTGTIATATLTVTLDSGIAGTVVIAPASPGRAMVPVVASLQVLDTSGQYAFAINQGMILTFRALCRDAAGVLVPAPASVVWTSTQVTVPVRVAHGESGVAFIENNAPGPLTAIIRATEPVSGAYGEATVGVFG